MGIRRPEESRASPRLHGRSRLAGRYRLGLKDRTSEVMESTMGVLTAARIRVEVQRSDLRSSPSTALPLHIPYSRLCVQLQDVKRSKFPCQVLARGMTQDGWAQLPSFSRGNASSGLGWRCAGATLLFLPTDCGTLRGHLLRASSPLVHVKAGGAWLDGRTLRYLTWIEASTCNGGDDPDGTEVARRSHFFKAIFSSECVLVF